MANINSILSEYVKLAYHGMRAQNVDFNVAIQEDLDPSIEPISVVAHDLSRVFLNIANNACYAAYEKKKKLGAGFSPLVQMSQAHLSPRLLQYRPFCLAVLAGRIDHFGSRDRRDLYTGF